MGDIDAEFALFENEIAELESGAPGEGAAGDAPAAAKDAQPVHPAAAAAGLVKGTEAASAPAAGTKRARVEYASMPVKRSVTQGFDPSVGPAHVDSAEDKRRQEEERAKSEAQNAPPKMYGSNSTPLGPPPTSMGGFQPAFGAVPLPVPALPHHRPLSAPQTAAPMAPPLGAVPGMPGEKQPHMRTAGGKKWEDASLDEWPKDDYRMFCGNLGNEVDDSTLARTFGKYPSFQKAKIVRDGRTKKPKGYGFVSFSDPADFTKAIKEMNGKYVGNRPVKLMKSEHDQRALAPGVKKEKPPPKPADLDTPWWKIKAPHKKKNR
eukprot:Tamp_21060.p1 GENE.Tamp_21060~~Tamp_21060.p1  ORF type:complete len:335 (-),score=68.69 Tamp_21060:160-1119(-)